MDSTSPDWKYYLEFAAQKYVYASTVALVFYDYSLVLDDEIRYVWKGRKTWIFYLYVLYRTLLLGHQFWHVYIITRDPLGDSTGLSVTDESVQTILTSTLLFFSDIFVTLRIYAITSKNKILTTYIATLALAKLVASLVFYHGSSFPAISIGTLLEVSAFAIVVWRTYPNIKMLKFFLLVRTLVTQATVYFIAVAAVHIFVLVVSAHLGDFSLHPLHSFLLPGLIIPVLSLRFAVSLKKSADPEGGQEWELRHFSTIKFASGPPLDSRGFTASDGVETDFVDASSMQLREPHCSMTDIKLRKV